ncbi:MAG TPA: HAD-IC family P-type ATPase [Dehalococcoidia bacterium]|nr:HAD-IC family P-type ATPase [Dehalococcoidia bacterium]
MIPASPISDVQTEAADWHSISIGDAVARLDSHLERGLSSAEAARRLWEHGPNTLQAAKATAWYTVLVRQFTDVLIFILMVAAVISLAVGEVTDAVVIAAILVLNGGLGFLQEWKAEQAIAALQRMLAPQAAVLRDGHEQNIEASNIVPGDVVLLDAGDRVPADLRLVQAPNLKVDESSLTGESVPVTKAVASVAAGTGLADRVSMVWMGTEVTDGRARGVVVATGMSTQFGRIARLTQTIGQEPTPLQRRLSVVGKQLGILAVSVSTIVVALGVLTGKPLLEMFLTGVSLAVAVVPEGLPAVVTITLALGIRAMVRRNALLRRLPAAETLGAASVICTDKTGTLTQNQMTLQQVWLPDQAITITGVGHDPTGLFEIDGQPVAPQDYPGLLAVLRSGLACNNARIHQDGDGWHPVGDPTETALVVAAYKAGLNTEPPGRVEREISFSSGRKRMTIIERRPDSLTAHVKGAPEVVLERSTRILDGAQERAMTGADRQRVEDAFRSMAGRGLRVLGLARSTLTDGGLPSDDEAESQLTFLGLVGLIDPPRPEVPEAVRLAYAAGIKIVMITGDSPETAAAIGRGIGLRIGRAVHGNDLAAMSDDDLRLALAQEALFARTTPEEKMRIVSLLQEKGDVVAMTGDGVNDAPALKKADIGIAMGIRGTDVAKGASDMVLLDDNFASIIGAVEEGRRQYDNIQKFVRYLLSSNMAELVAIFINIVLGGPLILLAVQILWMNLVTDGLTSVALGLEKPERGIMHRPPRPPGENILNRAGILTVLVIGTYMGLGTLWLFHHYLAGGYPVELAQTVAFTGLILMEKINVFNFRTLRSPLPLIGLWSNPWVLLAWTFAVGLQAAAVYLPFLQTALHTVPLGIKDWGLMLGAAVPVFIIVEGYKVARWWLSRDEEKHIT